MNKLPDLSSKRFLIADDMPFMVNLIHRMLTECGAVHITRAADGAAVLKAIKDDTSQVDYILADCNMRPVNGLQLLKAIRSGVNPSIPRDQPFIMVTGQGDPAIVKSAIMLDVSGYLVKPIALNKLIEAIGRVGREPLVLKSAEYYQAITLSTMKNTDTLTDSNDQKISAWVVLPRMSQRLNRAQINSKIDRFKIEQTSRDGESEDINLRNIRRCDLAGLVDGMVIAEDINADEDHILLRRGVRLNGVMIERLRELAIESGSRDYVMVGQLSK